MDIGSILLGLALLVVIAFVVARPLLERPDVADDPLRPADLLLASRERVLTQLRDLDFDRTMSKINEADYTAQRAQLVAEGVAILKQLDDLGLPQAGAEAGGAVDEIEAAVAQLRARRAAPTVPDVDDQIEAGVTAVRRAGKAPAAEKIFCTHCGAEAVPGDRFCARCGTALPAAAPGLRQAKVQS